MLSLLVDPFNKLMLSRYVGVARVPVLEISFRSAVQIRSLVESGLRAIMPEVSRLSGIGTNQSWQRIKQINLRAVKLIMAVAFPIYIIVFIAAQFLLKLWLREQYTVNLTPALRIMLIGSFFSLAGVPAFHTIIGLGRVRYCLIANAIIAVGNALIVSFICVSPVALTVERIGLGLAVVFGLSTAYLIYKFFTLAFNYDNKKCFHKIFSSCIYKGL
jgi:O-antigen/teichoic acid export membrane protein